jgi:hypothetical protein
MKNFNRILVAAVFGATLTLVSANAQTVNERRENQQDRIGQGVNSGQLTAGETANLESKESALNHEIHNDRTMNNGKLTAGERAQVNRQQNRLSRQIYRDKHNGRKQ